MTAKHGLIGLAKVTAKEGAKYGVRANVICPGFVRTPLVNKQIPEQTKQFGISESEVIKKIMLKDAVDGEFTTLDDIAEIGRRSIFSISLLRRNEPQARIVACAYDRDFDNCICAARWPVHSYWRFCTRRARCAA